MPGLPIFLLEIVRKAVQCFPFCAVNDLTTFLRYPGGKRRMLDFLAEHLPSASSIRGKFREPFVGGGTVYFHLRPTKAVLSDVNRELIELYRGIKLNPSQVWRHYRKFPAGKKEYREIRDMDVDGLSITQRAARSLYLNRTCFKGMWRHNRNGKFNIGYGGQGRRWVIARKDLFEIARLLNHAVLVCSDFESIIERTQAKDFIFADPPYRPGERQEVHQHYAGHQFTFEDHQRLATSLRNADRRGVSWALTVSGHKDIRRLYKGFQIISVPRGTSRKIGVTVKGSGEILVRN